jgi:hypothetical protein
VKQPLAVVVHDLPQARAALELEATHGLAVTLVSAPSAARYAGVGFLHAMEEQLGRRIVVDCGEDAGLILAGLRAGLRSLLFSGPAEVTARLADIAGQLGGEVRAGLGLPALYLAPGEPPTVRIADSQSLRLDAAPTPALVASPRR